MLNTSSVCELQTRNAIPLHIPPHVYTVTWNTVKGWHPHNHLEHHQRLVCAVVAVDSHCDAIAHREQHFAAVNAGVPAIEDSGPIHDFVVVLESKGPCSKDTSGPSNVNTAETMSGIIIMSTGSSS